MANIPNLQFQDSVRTVQPSEKEDKVSVSFSTKPAYYWVDSNNKDAVELLHSSHKNKAQVVVEWNPRTLEVTKVTPA